MIGLYWEKKLQSIANIEEHYDKNLLSALIAYLWKNKPLGEATSAFCYLSNLLHPPKHEYISNDK